MTQDEEQLNLLSIFHFVVGGANAVFSCFPLIHFFIGMTIVTGTFDGDDTVPQVVGWLFVLLSLLFVLGGWALSALIVTAGLKLRKRKSLTFCQVVAGIECILIPFGTVLGVLTLIVLTRESVKTVFESRPVAHPIIGDS